MKKLTFLVMAFVLAACCMTGCRRGSGAITDPQETTNATTEATFPTEVTVTMPTNEPAVTLPTDWTAGTDGTSMPQDETGESLGRGRMPGIN